MDDQPQEAALGDVLAENAELRRLLDAAKESETDARRAVNLLSSVLDRLPIAVTAATADGTVLFANEMAGTLSGIDPLPAGGLTNGDGPMCEERAGGPQGERTLLVCRKAAQILDRPLMLTAALDFTERKQSEVELSRRAYVDELTGLPNASWIQDQVSELLAANGEQPRFALAFLDLDNFEQVNNYYTHAIGDALLVKVGQRISAHIRPSDSLGRAGGDKFMLVIGPLENDDELQLSVENIVAQLKEPFLIQGYEILTSASAGVCVYPDHGMNYEMLRRGAETAMYRAKSTAKGGVALFDSSMGRAVTARMIQEQRLRLAVRDGRFSCAFQPKVDIRTEEVVGVEALIRLRDEDGLIQAPGEFIGLAIELGLIDDLTYLALAEIVRSMDLLDEAFGPHTTISINVAAKQASDPRFMADFCDELKKTGHAARFMVEVTEDAFLAKTEFQSHFLPKLREIGTRVSVDDFGTGYSSLAMLADITADEIKIDRSFITEIHQRPRSQSVLKAIEAMSEALGMTVIAEGVETFEEVAYLQAATRIRFAQGFYFAKPIFLEEITPARRVVGEARREVSARSRAPLRG